MAPPKKDSRLQKQQAQSLNNPHGQMQHNCGDVLALETNTLREKYSSCSLMDFLTAHTLRLSATSALYTITSGHNVLAGFAQCSPTVG